MNINKIHHDLNNARYLLHANYWQIKLLQSLSFFFKIKTKCDQGNGCISIVSVDGQAGSMINAR